MRWFLYIFIHFGIVNSGICQRISQAIDENFDRQYIIQVSRNTDARAALSEENLALKSSIGRYSLKQIMDVPLNLWLVEYAGHNDIVFYSFLKSNNQIEGVVRNKRIKPRIVPDDTFFANQWQYINNGSQGGIEGADMDMDKAWDIATGGLSPSGDTIVVCVIDDGVNGNHEDMKDNMWINHQEIPGNSIDDDGNGYVDDYKGWNIQTNTDDVYSNGGHGTPVAGIVGARGNNKLGVSGVNWNVKIMAVNYGNASEANALSSYAYAYKMRKLYNETSGKKGAYVVVTNASWGINETKADEAPLWCALYDSLGSVGILNCGATANADIDVDVQGDLPTSCNSEYLISVTNLNRADMKLPSAGYGRRSIDIGAYGHQAYTVTRTSYGAFGGTSGATPHVSGIVGLLYAINCTVFDSIAHKSPSTAALIVKDMIFHGSVPLSGLKELTTTGGKLNAFRSAVNLKTMCENCSPPSGIVVQTSEETMSISWAYGTEVTLPVRYRKTTSNNWIVINNYSKGQTISDIDYCEEYEIQVGSFCGLMPDIFSYSKFVKSSGCCESPKINEIFTSDHTISFNWISSQPASFLLQFKSWEQDVWTDTLIRNSDFALVNLNDCTSYSFRIKATCDRYSNNSDFTDVIDISTSCGPCTSNDYCEFKPKDTSDEWIESFTIAGISNISGPSPIGFKDFAGTQSVVLNAGQKYPFEIKPAYGGTPFNDFFKIYIDLNQDGQWSADELLYETLTAVQNEVTDSVYIPESALTGISKMRVIMSYEQFDGACDNEEFEFGEVEDYCVNISSDLCPKIEMIDKIIQEKKSITFIYYADNSAVDSIKIELREFNSNDWLKITSKDTVVFDNLEECTLYQYRVLSYCGALVSLVSDIDTIRTECKNSTIDVKNSIKLAPNPAKDYIDITFGLANLSISELSVTDIAGRYLLINILNVNKDKATLDLSNLKNGIYFIKLKDQNGIGRVFKFIKM